MTTFLLWTWAFVGPIATFFGTLKFVQHNAKKAAAINAKTTEVADAVTAEARDLADKVADTTKSS